MNINQILDKAKSNSEQNGKHINAEITSIVNSLNDSELEDAISSIGTSRANRKLAAWKDGRTERNGSYGITGFVSSTVVGEISQRKARGEW